MKTENDRKVIMFVDDNPTNLVAGKEILKNLYKVYPIPSGRILFDLLGNVTPDMILLDIEMPVMDGFEVIEKLKENPDWEKIPVVFLTAASDEASERKGLDLGAVDYVSKPFSTSLLLKRIENILTLHAQKTGIPDSQAAL